MNVWLDGKLVPEAEASVNVHDHGVLYGDGVFEGIRVYGGRVFLPAEHIDRLYDGARAIRLDIPYSKEEMFEALAEIVAANKVTDGYIRLVVTRGPGKLGINPFLCERPCVFIIAGQLQMFPAELYEKGMSVIVASTVRNGPNALNPQIKSLNYLNNIMAKIEAIDAGVLEAIMLNAAGLVAEATGDNVFVVRGGTVITPPVSAGLLEGITRKLIMDLACEAGLPMVEADLSRYDLYTADECFFTGSGAEVIPVTNIDKRPVGDGAVGPITRQLRQAFTELVHKA